MIAYIRTIQRRTVVIIARKTFRCARKENLNLGKPELFEQKRLRNPTAREIDVNSLRSRGEASLKTKRGRLKETKVAKEADDLKNIISRSH